MTLVHLVDVSIGVIKNIDYTKKKKYFVVNMPTTTEVTCMDLTT